MLERATTPTLAQFSFWIKFYSVVDFESVNCCKHDMGTLSCNKLLKERPRTSFSVSVLPLGTFCKNTVLVFIWSLCMSTQDFSRTSM